MLFIYMVIFISVVLIVIFIAAAFRQGLVVRTYTEKTDKITQPVRLAVLSDLHSTLYGAGQSLLVKTRRKQKPDALLFTGDIADVIVPHDGTKQLFKQVGRVYPCFYVTGNHEFRSGEVEMIKAMLRSYGAKVLEGEVKMLEVRGQKVQICGIDDPSVSQYTVPQTGAEDPWLQQLHACREKVQNDVYSVLLTHRPERVEAYRHSGFDLVVAGHAHGGLVRIPGLVNGLFAPGQGLFPPYAGGRYKLGHTVLLVSRGLCKNWKPRMFNPPELVVVELSPSE